MLGSAGLSIAMRRRTHPSPAAVPPAASWRVLLLRSRAHQAQGSPHAAAVDVLRAEEQAPAEELRAALAEAAHRSVEATARSLGRTASCGRRHCIKCLDRAPRIALVPCGHAVLCQGCSSVRAAAWAWRHGSMC